MSLSDEDVSSLRIRLEDLYMVADKNLSKSKEDMLISDMKKSGHKAYYFFSKIKYLKNLIVKENKFSSALIYKVFSLEEDVEREKPKDCSQCEDGYIIGIRECYGVAYEEAYACGNCDLGRYRHRAEGLKFYNNELLTNNFAIKYERR